MAEEDNPLELRIDQVLAEYMQQCDSGVLPDREAFLQRHPDLKEQLSELLSAADWIQHLAGPTLDEFKVEKVESSKEVTIRDYAPVRSELVDSADETLPYGATGLPPLSGMSPDSLNPEVPSLESTQPILPCQFGDYVLERVLGRGGMGVVYCGKQSNLERPVAVKMIRSGALASDEEVRRFYAEARSAAKLDHPNIVTVYQCGEQNGHHYFSMDYVAGTDLSQMVKDGPIDFRTAARYVRDVARAIQFAHDRGILHRDLKPANILVDQNDKVRITDFGLAKFMGTETGLTATGAALGTPSYMSPEQAAGKVAEQHHATDVYSLGAILFTLVTGTPPFKSGSVVETILQVIHRPAPTARSINPRIPEDIETIVDLCLQKSPERRYLSAAALADDLDRFLNGSPIRARPMSQLRRAWYWLLGVPIFGAVLDNRVIEPTEAHRWVQRGLISAGLLLLAAWFALMLPAGWSKNRMPKTVRFASGLSGGSYDILARSICQALDNQSECQALVVGTVGSRENAERLESGDVDLALLQADAIGSPIISVVAPLYYEAVHVFVRRGVGINRLEQLRGRLVNIGQEKAGSRGIAEMVLESAGLTFDNIVVDNSDWHQLSLPQPEKQTLADAAIVVSRLGSSDIANLLGGGNYELMAIGGTLELALMEPTVFHPLLMKPEHYPHSNLPETGIATVATTAYLAATNETPAILVQTVLKHLFTPEMIAATGIVSAERAAHWKGLVWHPAAREFFQSYRGTPPSE